MFNILVNQTNCSSRGVYDTYFPTFDNYGTDKNVDPSDMDSKWLYIYFDNMQLLHDYDVINLSDYLSFILKFDICFELLFTISLIYKKINLNIYNFRKN